MTAAVHHLSWLLETKGLYTGIRSTHPVPELKESVVLDSGCEVAGPRLLSLLPGCPSSGSLRSPVVLFFPPTLPALPVTALSGGLLLKFVLGRLGAEPGACD